MKKHRARTVLIFSLFLLYAVSPLFHGPPDPACGAETPAAHLGPHHIRVLLTDLLYSGMFGSDDACTDSCGSFILKKKRAVFRLREGIKGITPVDASGSTEVAVPPVRKADLFNAVPDMTRSTGCLAAFSGLSPPCWTIG